jgi:hypothetical protein
MIMLAPDLTKNERTSLPSYRQEMDENRQTVRGVTGRDSRLAAKRMHLTERTAEPTWGKDRVAAGTVENGLEANGAEAQAIAQSKPLILRVSRQSTVDQEGQQVLRAHFAREICTALRKIQPYCGKPGAAMYADVLLRSMRAMRDLAAQDPLLEVILALHDALAYKGRWADFRADQYEGAYQVVRTLSKRRAIRDNEIEKAIIKLENLGFDTTPFVLSSEDNDKE